MKLITRLSLTYALVMLITLLLVSLLVNASIHSVFKDYVQKQLEHRTLEIIESMSGQYDASEATWDIDFVHTIGMHSLYDGYIVKVSDADGVVLWDAKECDMEACRLVMAEITERMTAEHPDFDGEFTYWEFPLSRNGETIGSINIGYFGPYFFSENDFDFLHTLGRVLPVIGLFALLLSVVASWLMARYISAPIGKAAEAAMALADGNYTALIDVRNSTRELTDLSDAVNHLANTLSYQETLRKQLTTDVSHELRTPITSVQTHLEAMIDGLWDVTKDRLSSCHEEIMRIGELVKDLENLARVDNDTVTLHKRPVSLSRVISKTVESLEMDIQNKNLSLTVTGDAPDVPADEDRIRQAAVNLLSNAVKYTPRGGSIDITISQTEKYAAFTIADDGVGIPENELPFVFERFYRADKSRNRKTGGSGIGLAIVKSIVEAHGGKVDAESRPGSGSRFTVMLPRFPPDYQM